MKKVLIAICLCILLLALFGCSKPAKSEIIEGGFTVEQAGDPQVLYPFGELVYVPAYSSIFHFQGSSTFDLTATLSIHNISEDSQIRITRVDYYDANGALIRSYLSNRLMLKPWQTVQFVIREDDKSGGTGAKFIVEWRSDKVVANPLIETVMISTSGQQGVSFTTRGTTIKKLGN